MSSRITTGKNNLVDDARLIIQQAIDQYNPTHLFGLFSGGHDSLCACHIASQHPRFSGVIHINTGIGIQDTREYVYQTCRDQGWKLKEYHPPETYESLVIERGFPGPGMHWKMYQRLKERCLRQILRDNGTRNRKIGLVSGRRKNESLRRMVNVQSAIQEGPHPSKRAIWINPIIAWIGSDKNDYILNHNLPRNPVVEILCMSGECLCGAFAKPGELEYIRRFYPDTAAEIDRIAAKVKQAGKPHKWGERPDDKPINPAQIDLPLCYSCQAKHEGAS